MLNSNKQPTICTRPDVFSITSYLLISDVADFSLKAIFLASSSTKSESTSLDIFVSDYSKNKYVYIHTYIHICINNLSSYVLFL